MDFRSLDVKLQWILILSKEETECLISIVLLTLTMRTSLSIYMDFLPQIMECATDA